MKISSKTNWGKIQTVIQQLYIYILQIQIYVYKYIEKKPREIDQISMWDSDVE